SGTDPQALGPINFYLSEGMFKMFIGIYLIMVNDPQILFNDGFYPLLHVVMPEGSLLRPRFPAALGCRTHALARLFDVLGGALFHRGGNGVEKRYVYLEPGEVSIHDDRWLTRPWGVLGGEPGGRSEKILKRANGTEERLPSKCDNIAVEPGDMLVYRTAGGGGWKDRLDRPVEAVVRDVSFGLVSAEEALEGYG